ncbi:MAG: hypothetical protein HZB67_02295 [Candidatus Aenigmarchaeota archaeon]|nr:hypothetical protein [Candidatus Aenigmarchaeota archaeon]
MLKVFEIAKKNYKILLIAALVGIIFGLPHILSPMLRGDDLYRPLATVNINGFIVDEVHLASNVRDVYDGHLIVSDSQLYENKNTTNIASQPLPYLVLGLFTHLTGSVTNTYIIGDFLFPAIIFLLVYFFLMLLTKNQVISMFGGGFILFFEDWIRWLIPTNPEILSGFLSKFSTDIYVPISYFSRLPFMQYAFIEFMVAIIFLYLAIKEGKKLYILLAGITAGLLFYSYFYYWTFFFASLFVIGLVFLATKQYKITKNMLMILIIALLISIPFWVNFVQFRAQPGYEDLTTRTGLEYGRFFKLETNLKLLLFFGLYLLLIRKRDLPFYFLTGLFLTGMVIINMQLVTGFTLQSYHWISVAIDPIIVLMTCYLIYQMLVYKHKFNIINRIFNPIKKHYKIILALLLVFFFFHGVYYNTVLSLNTYKHQTIDESKLEALDWLNKNTKTDDVVLSASIESTDLIPVYTGDNTFLPNAQFTTATTDEILDRVLIAYKIYNVSPSYLELMMAQDNLLEDEYHPQIYGSHVPEDVFMYERAEWNFAYFYYKYRPSERNKANITYPAKFNGKESFFYIPEDVRTSIMQKYLSYTNTSALFTKYRIDYVYCGPYERNISNMDLSSYKNLVEVWKNDNVTIYKVLK